MASPDDALSAAVFDTAIGRCALAWRDGAIVGLQLPEANADALRRRMRRRWPGAVVAAPPVTMQRVIDAVVVLVSGARSGTLGAAAAVIASAPLYTDGIGEFDRRVYDLVRTIPPGVVMTYGDVANQLGEPGAARAIGQAMGANPFPIIMPCHRVIAAHGQLGGFSANGGTTTKARLLEIEGAPVTIAPTLF